MQDSNIITYLAIAAIIVVIILSVIAAYYLLKVRQQQSEHKAIQDKQQEQWRKQYRRLAEDIQFIANAMLQEQCEITEGCMRIKVLMDKLDDGLHTKPEFQGIQSFFKLTQDMPTHQAYKDLPRQEQFKLDQRRYALEDEHREQILAEAKLLTRYQFEILNPH